jgi:hypothetical protein
LSRWRWDSAGPGAAAPRAERALVVVLWRGGLRVQEALERAQHGGLGHLHRLRVSGRGREQKASQVFGEAMELWGRLQQQGELESFEASFLEPHGGDLGGFCLLRGEQDALGRLRASDEFQRLTTRAQLIVENFGVVGAATGDLIAQQMQLFLEAAGELAYGACPRPGDGGRAARTTGTHKG